MKFKEMPYERPDVEALKKEYASLTERLRAAKDYPEARAVYLEMETLTKHVQTQAVLCSVRHSIDTRDAFYDAEEQFWNETGPELEEYEQAWTQSFDDSRHSDRLLAGFGLCSCTRRRPVD